MFDNIYNDKTILLTGHTGFKGSWLTVWLTSLGAKVVGYSEYLPSDPCNFLSSNLEKRITHLKGDIRDIEKLRSAFTKYKPDIVFHLAAQPIVRRSYDDPKLTFDTNVGGTVNVLECIRSTPGVKSVVIITSDKCYQNVEWPWGYRENDRLGGDDPYSASKAGAEIVCNSYIKSFFREDDSPRVATTRAGNVIGGGDWADARIIPDCVKAWSEGKEVIIRSPTATRPWQHVLGPLSGYLWLGANLFSSGRCHGEAFNFGPDPKINKSVSELLETFISYWGNAEWRNEQADAGKKESKLLKLSCDKALHELNWHPVLTFDETVRLTAEWYKVYYSGNKDMYDFSVSQIQYYIDMAMKQNLSWAKKNSK
ncbi:MAG: CDP-glucose 4,6-dehydratase [Nitrospirae bacterium]|nr:CDP-glucose 4,6-dehydratase [Nitrospirota bacterium]